MNEQCNIPVLLIAFNRPDTTSVVFQKIRDAQPKKLFVAVDGPRKNKIGEKELIERVKIIVQKIDWPCETYYHFSEINKGAEITVSSAITWVLEKEEYVIVLEDDIIASLSFFRFAEEMLIKYKDNERISLVSGCNFTPSFIDNEYDYFFTKYGHIWGWATWRRAWKYFNLYSEIDEKHLKYDFLKTICYSKKEIIFYRRKFQRIRNNGIGKSTWDAIANYIFWVNRFLCIVPKVNLTSNIGIYGFHAKGRTEHHFRSYDENFTIIKHPNEICPNVKYDIYHFENYIIKNNSFNLTTRLFRKMKRFLYKKILNPCKISV